MTRAALKILEKFELKDEYFESSFNQQYPSKIASEKKEEIMN